MNEMYAVEYSQSQEAFHLQPLTEVVESNSRRFWHKPKEMFDWTIIYIGTQRQCELMLVQCERKLSCLEEAPAWTH